jgi:flagellar biosynthesis/type III secretory pathway M-ring protein FliF/YscJ
MRKKQLILALIAIAIVGLAFTFYKWRSGSGEEVLYAVVQRGLFEETVVLSTNIGSTTTA